MAWLSRWRYRKTLTIASQISVTDYQVRILVGESEAVANSDVNCKICLPSFNDLRFTSSDGKTLLSYWIEDISGVSPLQTAVVWVKVPEISTETTIYMYYWNPAAVSVSSGSSTFVYFDDASSSNLANYNIDALNPFPATGGITWDSSGYLVKNASIGHIYAKILPLGTIKNIAVHADILRATNTANQQGGIAYCVIDPDHYGMARYVTTSVDNLQLYYYSGGTVDILNYRIPQDTWTKIAVGVYEDTAKAVWKERDQTLISEMEIALPLGADPGGWGLFSAYANTSGTKYRNIFARKHVLPEPVLVAKIVEPGVDTWEPLADYLIQQYRDGVSVPSFVDIQGYRMQSLADELPLMMPKLLSPQLAEGIQLDNIGRTVDAGREGLSDEEYREWIEFIQRANSAGGNPEIIVEYIRRYCGDYLLGILFDEGNAAVSIQLTTDPLPENFLQKLVYELKRLVPAAVDVRMFHSETGDIFAVEDEGTDVSAGAGFSEETGEVPSYTVRVTGGQFVDPIRI